LGKKISYKDTTIVIKGDTMVMFIEGFADTVYVKETNKQKVTTTVKGNTIKTEAICKEDSLKAKITVLEKALSTVKNTTVTIKEKHVPFWAWLIIGALGLYGILVTIKSLFK